VQAGSRDDLYGRVRETIDPDDMRGGYAIWSGTSFAAPYVSGLIARHLTAELMQGEAGGVDAAERATSLALEEVHGADRSVKESPAE
jgi:hypothetical protein